MSTNTGAIPRTRFRREPTTPDLSDAEEVNELEVEYRRQALIDKQRVRSRDLTHSSTCKITAADLNPYITRTDYQKSILRAAPKLQHLEVIDNEKSLRLAQQIKSLMLQENEIKRLKAQLREQEARETRSCSSLAGELQKERREVAILKRVRQDSDQRICQLERQLQNVHDRLGVYERQESSFSPRLQVRTMHNEQSDRTVTVHQHV